MRLDAGCEDGAGQDGQAAPSQSHHCIPLLQKDAGLHHPLRLTGTRMNESLISAASFSSLLESAARGNTWQHPSCAHGSRARGCSQHFALSLYFKYRTFPGCRIDPTNPMAKGPWRRLQCGMVKRAPHGERPWCILLGAGGALRCFAVVPLAPAPGVPTPAECARRKQSFPACSPGAGLVGMSTS